MSSEQNELCSFATPKISVKDETKEQKAERRRQAIEKFEADQKREKEELERDLAKITAETEATFDAYDTNNANEIADLTNEMVRLFSLDKIAFYETNPFDQTKNSETNKADKTTDKKDRQISDECKAFFEKINIYNTRQLQTEATKYIADIVEKGAVKDLPPYLRRGIAALFEQFKSVRSDLIQSFKKEILEYIEKGNYERYPPNALLEGHDDDVKDLSHWAHAQKARIVVFARRVGFNFSGGIFAGWFYEQHRECLRKNNNGRALMRQHRIYNSATGEISDDSDCADHNDNQYD